MNAFAKWYQARKAQGRCIGCGASADAGVYCVTCAKLRRRKQNVRDRRRSLEKEASA